MAIIKDSFEQVLAPWKEPEEVTTQFRNILYILVNQKFRIIFGPLKLTFKYKHSHSFNFMYGFEKQMEWFLIKKIIHVTPWLHLDQK